MTGSTLELAPEHFRRYIAVKLTGTGDYTGSLSLPLGRVGLNSQTESTSFLSAAESISAAALISNNIIPIATPEDLVAINSTASHLFAGTLTTTGGLSKSYALIRDIDLSNNTDWNPIGDSVNPFSGSLDGNGLEISNLTLDNDNNVQGLFGVISGASVTNIRMSDIHLEKTKDDYGIIAGESVGSTIHLNNILITTSSLNGSEKVGGLIGKVESSVDAENITVSIIIHNGDEVGGLFGHVDGDLVMNITSAFVYGQIGSNTDRDDKRGGLIGDIDKSDVILSIANSINYANIYGSNELGGLIGYIDSAESVIISNSKNYGTIDGDDKEIGGLIGENDVTITITNSSNYGEIVGSGINTSDVGGIIGENDGRITLNNVTNNATASGVYDVGGIIGDNGYSDSIFSSFMNITNYGSIIAENPSGTELGSEDLPGGTDNNFRIGGLIGENKANLNISQSANYATVSAINNNSVSFTSVYVGGLIGSHNAEDGAEIKIYQSYNIGNVSSNENSVGGLIGNIQYENDVSNVNSSVVHLISDSYNIGTVSGDTNLGGLVGSITGSYLTIENSYAASLVSGSNVTGALIGEIRTGGITFSGVFYPDTAPISIGAIIGSPTINGNPTATSIVNMVLPNTFIDAGWNITDASVNTTTWSIGFNGDDNTYPYLTFQGDPFPEQIPTLSDEDQATLNLLQRISSEGLIPIANLSDLEKIASNQSDETFADNTLFKTTTDTTGLTDNYIIVQDIDLSGYEGVTAVINDTFTGNISGMGFTLSNLSIDGSSGDLGLFKELENSSISNLKLNSFSITGTSSNIGALAAKTLGNTRISNIDAEFISISSQSDKVGGFIGENGDFQGQGSLEILNSKLSLSINGSKDIGGVIGFNWLSTTLSAIEVRGQITDKNAAPTAGGMIGKNYAEVSIIESINFSTVKLTQNGGYGGGFIGWMEDSGTHTYNSKVLIKESINLGEIDGVGRVGGFVGYGPNAISIEIKDSFSVAVITSGDYNVGGFGGQVSNTTVSKSFSSASFPETNIDESGSTFDPLFGLNSSDIIISGSGVFYEKTNLGDWVQDNSIYNNNYSIPSGLSNSSMTAIETYEEFYDIAASTDTSNTDSVWVINSNKNDGYPYLRWAEAIIPED